MNTGTRDGMQQSPPAGAAPESNRRRTRYVDHVIQKWMLVALVVMESTLIAIAMWALYRALGAIIDDSMYRIHHAEDMRLLPRFLIEGVKILAGIGVINLLAIIAADRIWAAYVYGIVQRLDALIEATRKLDLSEKPHIRSSHAVLDQALQWRRAEAERLRRIGNDIRALPPQLPAAGQAREHATAALARLRDAGSGADA